MSEEQFWATHWWLRAGKGRKKVRLADGIPWLKDGTVADIRPDDTIIPLSRQALWRQRNAEAMREYERAQYRARQRKKVAVRPLKEAWRDVDWAKSDQEIAAEMGVSSVSVCRQRGLKGVSRLVAVELRGLGYVLDEIAELDAELAERVRRRMREVEQEEKSK